MRMIAGAILILSAAVLYSVRWLGNVVHNSVTAGSNEAGLMSLVAVMLFVGGLASVLVGAARDAQSDSAKPDQR